MRNTRTILNHAALRSNFNMGLFQTYISAHWRQHSLECTQTLATVTNTGSKKTTEFVHQHDTEQVVGSVCVCVCVYTTRTATGDKSRCWSVGQARWLASWVGVCVASKALRTKISRIMPAGVAAGWKCKAQRNRYSKQHPGVYYAIHHTITHALCRNHIHVHFCTYKFRYVANS